MNLKIRNFINSNLKINLYHLNNFGKKSIETIKVPKEIMDKQIDIQIDKKFLKK